MKHEHNRWFLLKGVAWVCSGLFFFQCAAYAEVPEIEREALVAFYDSTNGEEWISNTNWLTGDPCIDAWSGVACDESANIIGLNLVQNNLVGQIPAEVGNLSSLQILDTSFNFLLKGKIPKTLGNLIHLAELRLHGTRLGGWIPSELGNLTNLQI